MYRGTWHGLTVAIKVLGSTSLQGLREFSREVDLLKKYRHQHLVPLLGFCLAEGEGGQKQAFLVYPMMLGGALSDALSDAARRLLLPAAVRLRVAADVAAGLQYLHAPGCGLPSILHRDIKSSNVLLDEALRARISDVGFARPMTQEATMTMGVGTWGYIDPNYISTGEYGPESDIFSLGVILLELLTGAPASDPTLRPPHLYARMQARLDPSSGAVGAVAVANGDAAWTELKGGSLAAVSELAKVALECVKATVAERPRTDQVCGRKILMTIFLTIFFTYFIWQYYSEFKMNYRVSSQQTE